MTLRSSEAWAIILLVSCIIPTGDRRTLLPLALASYLSQDWPEKELVIIDDGALPVSDLIEDIPACVYTHIPEKLTIGAKRNLACSMARGDIIVHFDDDDWSAPHRITDQVERMLTAGKQVSGYYSIGFWDPELGKAYQYRESPPPYSCGTALCYTRAFWQDHPFPNKSSGEDNAMVDAAKARGQIISADGTAMLVARVHRDNVTKTAKRVGRGEWPEISPEKLPPAFFAALDALESRAV